MTGTLDLTALMREVNSFFTEREGDLETNLPQFLHDFGDILAKRGIILRGAYDVGKNPGGFGTITFYVGDKVVEAQIPFLRKPAISQADSSGYVGELGQKPSAYKACYH